MAQQNQDDQSGVTIHKPEKCFRSYTLYNSRLTEVAHLIDMDGNDAHQWAYPQGETWHYAEMLPNGHLVAIIKETEDQYPGMILELDWESHCVWQADVAAHHDFDRLANGNTVVVCRDYVENDRIRERGVKSDSILELTPDNEVVWEWHADEHVEEMRELVDMALPRPDFDWAHTNTVESLPQGPAAAKDPRFKAGNLMFSCRHIDTIGVIEKETGRVVWAWGPGVIDKQHMPTMLDNGHILVYDNGTSRKFTRVLELDPVTEQIVWEYKADPPEDFFSPARGSNQRLPNGNTFIAESDFGRLFEVTPDGELVWEFRNPDLWRGDRRQPLYRALRYAPEAVEHLLAR